MPPASCLLEVCVDNILCALAAQRGGASRIELCDNLAEDGTTPSAGSVSVARESLSIPVHMMIRPRGGDFVYTDREIDTMMHDISTARFVGVRGVVLGALTPDRRIDLPRMAELTAFAKPLEVTFHRAFDELADPFEALTVLIRMGVKRVLTSGLEPSVNEGLDMLRRLSEHAGDAISIMPGGGVTAENVPRLLGIPHIREIHVSGAAKRAVTRIAPNTGATMSRAIVEPDRVAAVVRAIRSQWR
jgi:copper homeostasis protein